MKRLLRNSHLVESMAGSLIIWLTVFLLVVGELWIFNELSAWPQVLPLCLAMVIPFGILFYIATD